MTTYYNAKNQPFKILREFSAQQNGINRTFCEVEFLETGRIDTFRKDAVKRGTIKDRYAKDVFEVACIGAVKKVNYPQEYNVWKNMIDRCYNTKNRSYPIYGGKGVTVIERWLCFENFLSDISEIEGYDEEKFKEGLLELDKDVKQMNIAKKVYSLETCSFLSPTENTKHRDMSLLSEKAMKVVGISPSGEEILIENVVQFAKDNEMSRSHIYRCVQGERKTHKKWRFKKYE